MTVGSTTSIRSFAQFAAHRDRPAIKIVFMLMA
jgi:hypothetical protein